MKRKRYYVSIDEGEGDLFSSATTAKEAAASLTRS